LPELTGKSYEEERFFDFLHRRQNLDFDGFLAQSREGEDYIN